MNSYSTDDQSFNRFAENWWDPKGELKTLHIINPTRLNYTDNACRLINKRVLDVGCGGGIFSEAMARLGARVTAIDVSDEVIQAAREHADNEALNIEYITATIETFSDKCTDKFDIITCMELLEHVPNPDVVIKTMTKLIVPGGDVILSTINRTASAYIKAILVAEHLTGLIPKHTHEYAQFIKPSEMSQLLRKYGFEVIDITGLKYIPIVDYVSLSDDLSVNYLLHAKHTG